MTKIEWKEYTCDNNKILFIKTINDIETSFKNTHCFKTKQWRINFDLFDNNPKVIKITQVALKARGLVLNRDIINYIKNFIIYYLEDIDFDFNRIPDGDILNSLPILKQ